MNNVEFIFRVFYEIKIPENNNFYYTIKILIQHLSYRMYALI